MRRSPLRHKKTPTSSRLFIESRRLSFNVDRIRGELLPQVGLVAGYSNNFETGLGEIDTGTGVG